MSSLMGSLFQIPLAKILDTWGRPQGLALVLFFWVIGFIMMACCSNVETYAAAQVFSDIGYVDSLSPSSDALAPFSNRLLVRPVLVTH